MQRAYAAWASWLFLWMSFRPYKVPPTAPMRPPIAAPFPAPLPPPAIAPPAAPTAAPPAPPMATSFTTSMVLSRWLGGVAAYLLHVSIADWGGTDAEGAGLVAAGVGGLAEGFTAAAVLAVCSAGLVAVRFATTTPVTTAVTTT